MKKLLLLACALVYANAFGQITNPPTWNPPQPPIFIGSSGQVLTVQPSGALAFQAATGVFPAIAPSTIVGNNTGSTTTALALNPLAIANMMYAVLATDVATTANITLSGTQTIDGVALNAGQAVLVANQSTASQNGIYIVNAGAWPRAAYFPTGYVIPQFCDVIVYVRAGTANAGRSYFVDTSASALTIGTTNLTIPQTQATATTTRVGLIQLAGSGTQVAPVTGAVPVAANCVSWSGSGSIKNGVDANGQNGFCALTNFSTGHLILNNGGTPPTTSAGTLNVNSTDHWGVVTGLSGASSITITFGVAWPNNVASCVGSDSANTAVGVTYTSVSSTITAAVFAPASALTGTLSYLCLGTN